MKKTQRKIFFLICFAAAIVSGIVFSYNLISAGSSIAIASERTNEISQVSEEEGYTAFLMFASDDWSVVRMEPEEPGQNAVITGDGTYTVSLTESGIADVSGINVFCVDMIGLADAQNLNVSNVRIKDVVIKCDGNVVPADMSKMYFGCIEQQGTLRLEICNYYGLQKKDGADFLTYDEFDLSKFSFQKSLSVTFTLEGIEDGPTPTAGDYKITTAAGENVVEMPRKESTSASPDPKVSMSAAPARSAEPSGTPVVSPTMSAKPDPVPESSSAPITVKPTEKPVESTADVSRKTNNTKKKIYKNRKKITITAGQKVQLKYTKLKGKLRWKSARRKTATVNQKGYVIGKKKGKIIVTVTDKKKKYSCIVTVKPVRKKSYLSKTSVVLTGSDSLTLELINTSEIVRWSIETTEYADINSYGSKNQFCEIKTNGSGREGTFLVTASSGKYVYTCEVKVKTEGK